MQKRKAIRIGFNHHASTCVSGTSAALCRSSAHRRTIGSTRCLQEPQATRRCPFCDVGHSRPEPLDANEPANLAKAIEATVSMKAIAPKDLERVIVDSTVQERAIAFPTDSRLLDVARRKLVLIARRAGLVLRQTFEKEGRSLRRRAGG